MCRHKSPLKNLWKDNVNILKLRKKKLNEKTTHMWTQRARIPLKQPIVSHYFKVVHTLTFLRLLVGFRVVFEKAETV